MDRKEVDSSKISNDGGIDDLLDDVRRLARYAIETAQCPPSVKLEELYTIYHNYKINNEIPDSKDFRFLAETYQKLERTLGPVTAETLKATECDRDGDPLTGSKAALYVQRLKRYTYIIVAVILLAHLFHTWSGVDRLKDTEEAPTVTLLKSDKDLNWESIGEFNQRRIALLSDSANQENVIPFQVDSVILNDSIPLVYTSIPVKATIRQALVDHGPIQAIVTILGVISVYFIPFLYGALGAIAYILRITTEDLKNRQFDPRKENQYQSRIILGALSGGVIIFFVSDVLITEVQTPFDFTYAPIGFIAGYSTDFLFNTVERIINAILPRQVSDEKQISNKELLSKVDSWAENIVDQNRDKN